MSEGIHITKIPHSSLFLMPLLLSVFAMDLSHVFAHQQVCRCVREGTTERVGHVNKRGLMRELAGQKDCYCRFWYKIDGSNNLSCASCPFAFIAAFPAEIVFAKRQPGRD